MLGLGKYLWYRAITKAIRQVRWMDLRRDLVHDAMSDKN